MPVGSAIRPHLTRLARLRGINNGQTTWRAIPSVQSPGGSEDGSYESYEAGAFMLPGEPTTSNTSYIRPRRGPYMSFDFGVNSVNYACEETYSLHTEDYRDVNNAEGMKRYERAVMATSLRWETAMEVRLRNHLWNAAVYTNTSVFPAASQFQIAGGDPFQVIRQRWDTIERSAAYADGGVRHIWMNRTAFRHLTGHGKLTKWFPGQGETTARGTEEMVASELELDLENLHVGKMVLNSARERQTPVYQDVWNAASLWMGIIAPSIQEDNQTAAARIYADQSDSVVMTGVEDTGTDRYRWARQTIIDDFVAPDVAAAHFYTTVYV